MLWPPLIITLVLIWTAAAFLSLPGAAPSERIEHMRQRFINWYKKPKDPVRLAAYGALGLSAVIGVVGYFDLLPLPQKLIDDFYANGAAELASVAITVLIIDRLVERRAEQREKEQIIKQMGSRSNDFALEAVRVARAQGWLIDGSMRCGRFSFANLKNAILNSADFEEAHFVAVNFEDTVVAGVNFTRANLRQANLTGTIVKTWNDTDVYLANFTEANLCRADFSRVAIQDIKEADFTNARFDLRTIWPEGFDPIAHGAILVEDDE